MLRAFVFLIFLSWSQFAHSNVIWPGLILQLQLYAWEPIFLGLLIEYIAIRRIYGFGYSKALRMDFLTNLGSAAIGLFVFPISSILLHLIAVPLIFVLPDIVLNTLFALLFILLSAFINAAIEAKVIGWMEGKNIEKREMLGLALANTLSVSAAAFALWMHPPQF